MSVDKRIDKEKDDLNISVNKENNLDEKQEKNDIPQYMSQLTYSETVIDKLRSEIFKGFKALKEAREEMNLPSKWRMLWNQYNGKMKENSDTVFNLHRHTTKIKVNKIVTRSSKAFLKSEPIFSISPRPEFLRQDGNEICEKQQDFLDYKMDEVIDFKPALKKAFLSSAVCGVGIVNVFHEVKRANRRREETYKGVLVPLVDEQGRPVIDPTTKQPLFDPTKNDGFMNFLNTYPDAEQKYPGMVRKLLEGKEISIVVEFKETTYNDPKFRYVRLEDFYVSPNTEGYDGLCESPLIIERIEYSWYELKAMEKKGLFVNIDELMYKEQDGKKEINKNYRNETYCVLRCEYMFEEDESTDEENHIVCYFSEDDKVFLGAMNYMYYGVACDYIPFYMKQERQGFYQCGIAEDLTDSNIAENAIMNFILEGSLIANTVTPITEENSALDTQFLEKRWTHGLPLNKESNEQVDFLNRYMKPPDIAGMLALMNYMVKVDDDVTGVSSLLTGRSDPIDPSAPATKTLALMNESGENIEGYIETLLPSFNVIANVLLQMYHQIANEGGIRYKRRSHGVVGSDPFSVINKYEMIAKTNIQSQAMAFNFEKMNEKKENLALLSVIRQEPLFAQNPDAVHSLLKAIIKSWSPMWRNVVDKILPSLEQLQQKKLQTALVAIDGYVKSKVQESQITGIAPEFDPQQLIESVNKYVAEVATPPSEEELKERQKNAR